MQIKTSLVIIFCLSTLSAFAQSPIGLGGKQLNFGISGNGSYVPIYVSLDFGVHKDITIAPQLGLDLDLDWFDISFRGDYHFNTIMGIPQNWDFYAGLTAGYSFWSEKKKEHNEVDFHIGAQVGGRWYWNDKWGLNLEFGGDTFYGNARLGLSLKII